MNEAGAPGVFFALRIASVWLCLVAGAAAQKTERAVLAARKSLSEATPCFPGPPTKLRLRPQQARLQPAQRVCFTLVGVDDAGCPSEVSTEQVKWELRKPEAARANFADGCFRAAENAAEAEGWFRVIATYGELRTETEIVVRASDLSDITAQRGTTIAAQASDLNESVPSPASITSTGVRAAALRRSDAPHWIAFGAGAFVLAIAVWLGLRSRRPPRARARTMPVGRESLHPEAAPASRRSNTPVRASEAAARIPTPRSSQSPVTPRPKEPSPVFIEGGPMICPKCRRGFAPGSTTCTADAAALMPYAEFVKLSASGGAPKNCPQCGAVSAADSAFCGECGTKLST